ncbi:MAG: acyl carrier protein [Planctomycetes bacterium]|nr:acyl carrier protein [Planctomycetota bacterium]
MMNVKTELEVALAIYEFVCANFPRARSDDFQTSDQLIESGVVDSLGLLGIVNFIEMTFNMTVSDEDVVAENFASIDSIAAYIFSSAGESSFQIMND